MIWFILFFILLFILSIFFIPIRLTIFHPFLTIYYACTDIYDFLRYRKWNNFKTGSFDGYDANLGSVFGSGKTLSCVYKVRSIFYKYHNKKVFDFHRKKWVIQKIHILTNLTMKNLPYEKLENLGQIVSCCERMQVEDKENDTLTCIVVLIDECQNQLHCRSFKDNLSPLMLKSLTECRHYNMSCFWDAPRFSQVDALLRQCTSLNIKNNKIWRWQCQTVYDASDIENASNVNLVKPIKKTGFFIQNDLFDEYDTKEIIDNLVKAKDRNDFLTDEEILSLQNNQEFDIEAIRNKSKIAKRRLKGN